MEPDEKTLKDMCCHTVAVRERIKRDVQDIIKHQPCRLGLCEERMYHFLNMFTDELLRDDPHSDGSLTCEQGFSFLKDIKFFAKDSASETVVFSANCTGAENLGRFCRGSLLAQVCRRCVSSDPN